MFHFSVQWKDVDQYKLEELAEAGIIMDPKFQEKAIADVHQHPQKHHILEEDHIYVLEEMESELFFTATAPAPSSLEEAMEIIHKYFFFPPLCVWLSGKSYKIVGQYGEVDTLA